MDKGLFFFIFQCSLHTRFPGLVDAYPGLSAFYLRKSRSFDFAVCLLKDRAIM
jgi:hypothetical protein